MLYVKFTIGDESKYHDFQKLYGHMVKVRQPDFEFKEDEGPEFDWDVMNEEEVDEALKELNAFLDQTDEERRYKKIIPTYANAYLESYVGYDEKRAGVFGFDLKGIFNYLEVAFEVDMDNLEKLDKKIGLVEFSTGNYPYGGMERFLMILKAFDLQPLECFNGFEVYAFDWVSDYDHEAIDLPEKTKRYKEERKVDKT